MATSSWPRLFCIYWILVYVPKSHQILQQLQQDYQLWAENFGPKLVEVSSEATHIRYLEKQFTSNKAYLKPRLRAQMVNQFASDMDKMLQEKVEAVERLVDIAENAHMDYVPDTELKVDYYNAKQLNEYDEKGELKVVLTDKKKIKFVYRELILEENDHFNNIAVNTSISTVHVPQNVYNKAPGVLQGIAWSEKLDYMFRFNYERDPTLTWQYFGSATGFFRNFPGIKWSVNDDRENLDLFDCRARGWYIQAASSPKDMVIAIDSSGSMTGLRIEIAKQTVGNILDSLGDDDFVNVFRFNDSAHYMEPCFNQTLVQANLDNKKRLRDSLDDINKNTQGIADYGVALTEAFELLEKMNRTDQGAQCNQAIMLITDGSPLFYEEVFKKYNWPEQHVRVFTYLIGREVTQNKEVKWMSCENKGYFAHVSTLADVQEHVMKYIYVMSRPMVLAQNHTTIWTGAYLDMSDPKTEHWLSELAREKKQEYHAVKGLRLVTSVAQPVFDMRNDSRNNGNLLGVMGTDVPLKELMKLIPAFKLGVNSYSFAVTNNGYILFHPDLRPMHKNLPKPNYNSVDLVEVELDANEEDNPFTLNYQLSLGGTRFLRKQMVERLTDKIDMEVKMHYDSMKRVYVRKQKYFFTPILKTPFTLALAFENEQFGEYEVEAKIPVTEVAIDREFSGLNWKIAPHWIYCQLTNEEAKMDRRDMIKLYIGRGQNNSDLYKNCKEDLMESLAFDALVTWPILSLWEQAQDIADQYGIRSLFLSTRSGLTRYVDIPDKELEEIMESENITEKSFLDHHDGSIDEVYYKRAAEYGNGTFVFSVPFDAIKEYDFLGNISYESLTLVTGSSSVTLGSGSSTKKGIAAVVGIQFRYDKFKNFLWSVSQSHHRCYPQDECGCSSPGITCYLLDDHGYIIVTSDFSEVGRFFGEIHSDVMLKLEIKGVYKAIQLYDYQGMCPRYKSKSSDGGFLLNPFYNLFDVIKWTWKHTIWVMLKMTLYSWWQDAYAEGDGGPISDGDNKVSKNVSENLGEADEWYPCDLEFDRYLLDKATTALPFSDAVECNSGTGNCNNKEFSAHKIPNTNLLLLIVDSLCNCDVSPISLLQREVMYNSSTLCNRLTANIHRRRPPYCYSYHEDERKDETCLSEASCIKLSPVFFLGLTGIIFLHRYHS